MPAGRWTWLRRALVWSSLMLVGCTSSGNCPEGSSRDFVSGGCLSDGPVVRCTSWTSFFTLTGLVGEPGLSVERSLVPPRADLRVGSRMQVRVVVLGREPQYCGGPIDQAVGWRTSNPAALRVESASSSTATFIGVEPGAAQVFTALPRPTGGSQDAELSVCVDPKAPDDGDCARTPLTIRVVP